MTQLEWTIKLLISEETCILSSNDKYRFHIKRVSIKDDYHLFVYNKNTRTCIEEFKNPLLKNIILKVESKYNY